MQPNAQKTTATVLQVGPMPPFVEGPLHEEFNVLRLPDAEVEKFLATNSSQVGVVVTTSVTGVDAHLMRALPELRAIVNFGVGFDKIDVHTADELGVVVSNTPDVLTDCVADMAVGLLIDVARGISASDRFVRRGDWLQGSYPLGTRVSGKRVGILGLGRIGLAIAARLEAFGTTVAYHGRRRVADVTYPWHESLTDLAENSDFLIVAVASNSATAGIISAEVLEALGPKGYLINISRGAVVDEAALVDALVQQRIAGAGLDVFAHEPYVPQELLNLDNVVLAPHTGSATAETRQDMADLFLTNLRQFVNEGTLSTPIS